MNKPTFYKEQNRTEMLLTFTNMCTSLYRKGLDTDVCHMHSSRSNMILEGFEQPRDIKPLSHFSLCQLKPVECFRKRIYCIVFIVQLVHSISR